MIHLRLKCVFAVLALAAGLAAGLPLDSATQLANTAACIVVGKLGTATTSARELAQALAEQMGMQVINLLEVQIPKDALNVIDETMAQVYRVIPVVLDEEAGLLTVAWMVRRVQAPARASRPKRSVTCCGAPTSTHSHWKSPAWRFSPRVTFSRARAISR